ncbi:hypothetical protein Bbelb_091710 [Branchiostoma belcheri]|nr:hypothetical protein Bbelb_091710 [Branchiostoma belcheri]
MDSITTQGPYGLQLKAPIPLIGALAALLGALTALSRRSHGALTALSRRSHGDGVTRFHTIAEVTALMALSWRSHGDLSALSALWPISGRRESAVQVEWGY